MRLIIRILGALGLIFTGMVMQECYHQRMENSTEETE